MSARREKRIRSLERRVNKLEVMASAGYLKLQDEIVSRTYDSKSEKVTLTFTTPKDAGYQKLPSRSIWQQIKDFFIGGNQK